MNLEEYQKFTETTNKYKESIKNVDCPEEMLYLSILTNGLNEEAGEVAGKVKKLVRDKYGDYDYNDILSISKELGDCLWYISEIANCICINLESILIENASKLKNRLEKDTIKGSGDDR